MADEHSVIVNGARLRYRVIGSGPPLVVHPPGWGIGVGLYEHSYAPLAEHHTLIFVDSRGSGGSERHVAPETINVGQFVDDLEGMRVQLGLERIALTGHSHGGYVAVNYALRYPDRLTHLLAVDAQVGIEEPGEDLQRSLPILAERPEYADAVAAFREPWDLSSDEQFGRLLQRVLPLYFHDVACAASVMAGVESAPPAVATFQAASASDVHFTVRERLSQIQVPTLVLVGRHDFICSPVQAEILATGIAGARLHVFENSGHFPWIEEPAEFFSVVRAFLNT